MVPTRISPTRSTSPRDRAAGIGRPGGMLTAAVTAAVVFLAGRQFLAPTAPEVLTPTAAAPATPPPPPPAGPDDASAVASSAAEAGTATDATTLAALTADAGPHTAASTESGSKPADDSAPAKLDPPAEESATARGDKAADEATQADKDLARESWRKNKPDVHSANGKSSILIPLKGSSAGASHKYVRRIHTLVITLPKAASLNTLHFYKLHRDGFSVLWTDQAETNARASDGTKLRLVFTHHAVPDIEIRDEFVRVTIARPAATRSEPAEKPEPREPAPGDEKDKSKEKDAE